MPLVSDASMSEERVPLLPVLAAFDSEERAMPLPLVLAYQKIQNEVDHEHDDKPLIAWLLFNRKKTVKFKQIFYKIFK